jgi:hypothetical protein
MIYYFLIIFNPIGLIGSYFFLDKNDYIDLSFEVKKEQIQNTGVLTNSS